MEQLEQLVLQVPEEEVLEEVLVEEVQQELQTPEVVEVEVVLTAQEVPVVQELLLCDILRVRQCRLVKQVTWLSVTVM